MTSRQLFERSPFWYVVIAGALLVASIAVTALWLGPLPPRVVTMSTGTPGSDYELLAHRYQTILRRSGVELRLLKSAGGLENLRRLNDARSGVAVAFVQGGLTSEARSPDLQSLGTMFYEPLWFFCRCSDAGPRLEGLRGRKVSIGPEGAGTRALALQLFALNEVDQRSVQLLALPAEQAEDALLRGEIDAAAMLLSWDSAVVRRLLAASQVNVLSFPRADAYVALYPFLHKLTLPTGVGNLAANRPPADVELLAPQASLLVRRDLHPAIQYLLVHAAAEIHAAPSIFTRAGEFPGWEPDDLPLADVARQFAKSGAPLLQRYLPFGLAVLVNRLLLLLIPVVGIAYPLLGWAPRLYAWRKSSRIYSLYGELKVIEVELDSLGGSAELRERLEQLERRAHRLRLPVNFVNLQYQLRAHIALVRRRMSQMQSGDGAVQDP
jgi:TRAP-type uncharacterized transport system substrate-binding protein